MKDNKIVKGDWFQVTKDGDYTVCKITQGKLYQCTLVIEEQENSLRKIFFIADDDNEDWHYELQFEKCEPPEPEKVEDAPIPCVSTWNRSADELAMQVYKRFTDAGWSAYDLTKLTSENVHIYLDDLNVTKYSAVLICEIVKSLSAQAQITVEGDLIVSGSWQTHNPISGDYNTQPSEEEDMQETICPTNNVTIDLGDAAYVEITTIGIFGQNVAQMTEAQVYAALTKIEAQQESLKEMNKSAKSKRVTGQIAKLGKARNNIVKYLDSLPDSPKGDVKEVSE